MIVGIDASNLRAGGGRTHLLSVLQHADPPASGIDRVTVWSGSETAAQLPKRDWLMVESPDQLDGRLPQRVSWQQLRLPRLLEESGCDLLWSPGGTTPFRSTVPSVAMFQNALPFEPGEAARYPFWSAERMRLRLLHRMQARSLRNTAGVILLSEYARSLVTNEVRGTRTALIPHGIEERFRLAPRPQAEPTRFTDDDPFKILYVSPINAYKHQWHVAEAAALLRNDGLPVVVDFVGPLAYQPAAERLRSTLGELDPEAGWLRIVGPVPFSDLHATYHGADAFVFASTCENLPITLMEAMAAGLPIAASERPPMPEVLGDSGLFFDSEDPGDIASALGTLISNPELRANLAAKAHARAEQFSWDGCATATFTFLAGCAT